MLKRVLSQDRAILTVLYGALELELFRLDAGMAYTEPFALETGESKEPRLP